MERIYLKDQSFEKLVVSHSKEIEVIVEKNASCSFYLCISHLVQCTCKIYLEENAQLNFLTWNESEHFELENEVTLKKDAHLYFNMGELSDGTTTCHSKIYLSEEGAQLNFRSASTVATKKHFDIECIHQAPHTESQMENYAIIYENGDYQMVDTGTIKKGAYGSNSHQTSRSLVLSDKQKCSITPVLLIDENDVQASHATTMGQIDENQLYYLQTRGLTKRQALGLITIGYLMPIASSIEDEALISELTKKIEKKVGLA